MNDEAADRLAIDAAFAVLPWPRGQGGHQRMLRRFIRSARMRYYRVAPLSLLSRQQPCLLDLGHPQQARLLDSRRPVIYRAPDLCLPASVQPDAMAQGDHARIRDALMRADFILYQSRLSKQRMDALHLPAEGRWAIVPNGVCLNHFSPDPIGRQRQAGQPPVLGVVGPGCHHAWLTLLLAMSRRLTVRPHLLLVGRFDPDCQRVLDQALLDPCWQQVIEYVPRLSELEWVSYYRRMDCLLHPATGEAAPHEAIEALACGVPVLCPETAGSVEWIGNGGMVVPNPEPDEPWGEGLQAAVAAGVERLLEDLPALRRQARLQAEKENNIEIMTPLYLRGMGLPPGGPSRGWKYTAVRSIGQLCYPFSRRVRVNGNGRPRIGLVLWDWNMGGIASWMFRVAAAMPEFEFHFIATHLELHASRCDAVGRFAYTPGFWPLVRYLRQHNIDLLQASNNRWPVDAAKVAGVPKIIERTDGTGSCCRIAKGDLDWVIVSAGGTEPYIRRFWPQVPTQVIRNSVDLSEVDAAQPLRSAGTDQVVIGRCSRFGWGKRMDLLIDAMTVLVERGRPVQLVLAGEDSKLSGAASAEYNLRQQAAPLGDKVHFFGRTDTPLALAHGFDIAVCSSNPFNEGIPNSLIEPMACGKPVVATDIDQVSELVVDGVNGFLVPPGNAMALADALDRLVTDPSLRRQMGQAARRTVEERFSFTVALDRYRTLYRRLLDLS
ncbi:MAG: glycosyltransferase family 4 protein [Magnetococcales bacterium]|nr:glycosyltransferase family 4 protein [Magnetococcales bacterium]